MLFSKKKWTSIGEAPPRSLSFWSNLGMLGREYVKNKCHQEHFPFPPHRVVLSLQEVCANGHLISTVSSRPVGLIAHRMLPVMNFGTVTVVLIFLPNLLLYLFLGYNIKTNNLSLFEKPMPPKCSRTGVVPPAGFPISNDLNTPVNAYFWWFQITVAPPGIRLQPHTRPPVRRTQIDHPVNPQNHDKNAASGHLILVCFVAQLKVARWCSRVPYYTRNTIDQGLGRK